MVDFAGWQMPIQYTSISEEHLATRSAVGLFDVSHMARLRFDGPGASAFLDQLLTRRVSDLRLGRAAYSLVTNEQGGILDDVLVYHLADAADQSYYVLVVNAGNHQKITAWLDAHESLASDATWQDVSRAWAMIAVQGPKSAKVLDDLVEADLASLSNYDATETLIAGHGGVVSRTGYTGEDGFELMVGNNVIASIWETLVERSTPLDGRPAGLGCRDTLRLEAGMPLYGHELSEEIDPYRAGLGFAVDLSKEFIGRDALEQRKAETDRPRRVGIELDGRRVPREGYAVLADAEIGHVTSGTFSPTLERPIAMAYIEPGCATPGTELKVDIRGRHEPCRVVRLPFYRR